MASYEMYEMFSEDFTGNELGEYLKLKGASDEVVETFANNRVDGRTFLLLTEEDLKQLITLIGERALIRTLLKHLKEVDGRARESDSVDDSLSRRPLQEKTSNTDLIQLQPPSSTHWHKTFIIPNKHSFSGTVQKAIETGVVCSKSRREISQTIRTLMLQHTRKPTSEEYTEICFKLVQKFPKLHDGGKSGSGGWKLSLRTGFKNFRRDHPDDENMPAEGSRGTSSTDSPLSKRRKTVDIEDTISAEEYEEAITQMKTEHSKKRGKNHALIKTLMEETRSRRRIWITQEFPMVKEILEKFPFVSSAKTLRREFRAISGCSGRTASLLQEWSSWTEKIIGFSKVEAKSRTSVRKILEEYDKEMDVPFPTDRTDYLMLSLLLKLLYAKGLTKNSVFMQTYETCDVDLDTEVGKTSQSAPYIIITGEAGQETTQYFIACEKAIFTEAKSIQDAVVDLLAVYYVCNIAYPRGINAIMLFLQHTFFELNDSEMLPTPTSKLIHTLNNFTV